MASLDPEWRSLVETDPPDPSAVPKIMKVRVLLEKTVYIFFIFSRTRQTKTAMWATNGFGVCQDRLWMHRGNCLFRSVCGCVELRELPRPIATAGPLNNFRTGPTTKAIEKKELMQLRMQSVVKSAKSVWPKGMNFPEKEAFYLQYMEKLCNAEGSSLEELWRELEAEVFDGSGWDGSMGRVVTTGESMLDVTIYYTYLRSFRIVVV